LRLAAVGGGLDIGGRIAEKKKKIYWSYVQIRIEWWR